MNKKDVLDKGYIRLVDSLGSDLRVINAARASFNKESTQWSQKEEKLLNYLWKNGHKSVFRHCALTFEIYAPFMVARQWWKYAVASSHLDDQTGWNESSRRYVTEEPEFYIPHFRSAPDNKKQGSGDFMPRFDEYRGNDFPNDFTKLNLFADETSTYWENKLSAYAAEGEHLYREAMNSGVAPEQARLFLPAYGMYIRWYWTCSLASFMHFLEERLDEHAQYEIRAYAEAASELARGYFPKSLELL